MTKIAAGLIYFFLAALVAGGLLYGVNQSIDSQTDVLREIRSGTRAQVCVLVAPLTDTGRDEGFVNANCLVPNGIAAFDMDGDGAIERES